MRFFNFNSLIYILIRKATLLNLLNQIAAKIYYYVQIVKPIFIKFKCKFKVVWYFFFYLLKDIFEQKNILAISFDNFNQLKYIIKIY